MSQFRKGRLESNIEHLLAKEIVKTLELQGQLITITNVSLDENMERATVHVEVFPESDKRAILDELGRKTKKLQHFLLKNIPIRKIPHLIFE
ncbi:hypothetical protein A2755_00455 [Candidatus Wolfebacteria bacterium RIFCSPHIGHO2_01_FULL_48_22]|uniref:Ribosome-binding factor A n=2 Tax=Candidatus Wolfeibacteriota TaxID=1752735 RepID=A0A1F8DT46_9BACT|nr:MAG: hypothetical protein A2755_00455 [Candidatus Wolfebacteria bacterium RIFCSPHIGHO2_01_FULL_48_22]OGM93748.1 MAG: hypothetical protein A2935_03120 [Candidatus Wolfebacteria bacterium RIFCSPLOWO2_01_FULL_47_17b]